MSKWLLRKRFFSDTSPHKKRSPKDLRTKLCTPGNILSYHIHIKCVHLTFYVAIKIQDSWACGTWRHVASCLCSPWMHILAVWGCSVDAISVSCSALATAPPSSASGPHPGPSVQQLKPPETETCLESPAAVKKRRTLRENSAISILLAMWWTDIRECGVCYMTDRKQIYSSSYHKDRQERCSDLLK